jgi:hypothetical protein
MKRVGLGLGGLLCTALASAADPVPATTVAAPTVVATPAATPAAARPPLNLRIGDIREYMSAEDFRALSAEREPDSNTVIVEARAPLLEVKEDRAVPGGIMAPIWALVNPTQAWRIFVPDLKRPADGPPDSKIPPPVFRWGP